MEEAVEKRGEEEPTQSLGGITVEELWCDGMGDTNIGFHYESLYS